MEGRFYTLRIRKFEAEYLRKIGYGWAVQNGHGTYHNPLVAEDQYVINVLNRFRNSIKVK